MNKRTLTVIILILSSITCLFAHNNLLDTGQSGYFIEAGYDNSKPARFLNEFSTGYTFKNGLGINLKFAYESYVVMTFLGPNYHAWNLDQGIEVAYPFLKQKERSMPVTLSVNAYYHYLYSGHYYDSELEPTHTTSHFFELGLNISRRFRFFKHFEFIPLFSAKIKTNNEIYLNDGVHKYIAPVFTGQTILRFRSVYAFAGLTYQSGYIYDSISYRSQLSTHLGLGFIIPNKK